MAVEPLPPIQEDAFSAIELSYLKEMFNLDILMLYKKAKAIKLQKFLIGAKKSRHSKSSFVMTQTDDQSTPVLSQIQYFAEYKATNFSTQWIVAVNTFVQHSCKVWFGNPAEVWTITPNSMTFIPINAIRSRVVYSKSKVDFGSRIGEEMVI